MLNSQVIMNLLPKLRIGVDLTGRGFCFGERFLAATELFLRFAYSASAVHSENNEFHKRLSVLG